MTIEEAEQYFGGLAQQAGLDEETKTAVVKAMRNEAFGKPIRDGFLRQEEFSRKLDDFRTKEQRYEDWYRTEQAKFSQWERDIKEKERLEAEVERMRTGGALLPENNPESGTVTLDSVRKLMDDQLRARDAAYVGLAKSLTRAAVDYGARFNEPLDVDALEKFALDKGLALDQAYREFIAPKVEAKSKLELTALIKKEREEAVREFASRTGAPVDGGAGTARPGTALFQQTDVSKLPELEQERHSAEAFFTGWNNPKEGAA